MASYFEMLSNLTHALMGTLSGDWVMTGIAIFGGVFVLVMFATVLYCAFACRCKPIPGMMSTGLGGGEVLRINPKCPIHGGKADA